MLDEDSVSQLGAMIANRFTADELCEILGLEAEDIFERFTNECLEVNWEEYL